MVTIKLTETFERDFKYWLSKHCDDGYGKKYEFMTEEEKNDIREDFVPERVIENSIYTNQLPRLNIRDKHRQTGVPYESFDIKTDHFTVTVNNPWTGNIQTILF